MDKKNTVKVEKDFLMSSSQQYNLKNDQVQGYR